LYVVQIPCTTYGDGTVRCTTCRTPPARLKSIGQFFSRKRITTVGHHFCSVQHVSLSVVLHPGRLPFPCITKSDFLIHPIHRTKYFHERTKLIYLSPCPIFCQVEDGLP
jgi:hypothetical protein